MLATQDEKRQTQTVRPTEGKSQASKRWNSWPSRVLVGLLAGIFVLFVGVPLAALLLHEPPGLLWRAFHRPEVFSALAISLLTTTMSTLFTVLLGLPVAYLLARTRLPGRALVEALVTLPTILPPVVAGVALLLAFGRLSLIGRYLNLFGITLPFTTAAVVMAQIFVSAPFFINSARVGLEQLDEQYELAAYTMGASRWGAFRHIVLPLVRPALLTGIGLAWARSVGELGATITFAGNLPGITQTLSIAVYLAAQDDLDTAVALSVLLLAVSFGVLLVVQLGRRKQGVDAETRGG